MNPPPAFAVLAAGAILCLLLATILGFPGATATAEDSLPAGVVARVYGKDIRESDLLDRVVRRWGGTERGKLVLDQVVDDLCVEMEAGKRGVSISDDEVTSFVKQHVDEMIRKQTGNSRSIEDVYKEQHSNAQEFAQVAREYLKRQRMAAADLGAKPGEEVSEARLKLWLSSLRRRMNVKVSGLPEGVFAQVGDTLLDRARFARALKEHLPEEATIEARADLVLEAATDHALLDAKISVSDADVDAEIAKMRERFAKDPRVKGTDRSFDEFLHQLRGTSEAQLRADPVFRSRIGLERLLAAGISDASILKQWEDNRDAYGERALVRQIYFAGQDEGGKFKMRTFKEAFDLCLGAKGAILEAAGTSATESGGKRPLSEVLTAVAKQVESDQQKRNTAGEPVAWTQFTLAGESALMKAVFEGDVGTLLGPVRSRVGYHLLLVEERRPAPTFDEVKGSVREDLLRKAIQAFQLKVLADDNVIVPR